MAFVQKRCPRGHFYDSALSKCPVCACLDGNNEDDPQTMNGGDEGVTQRIETDNDVGEDETGEGGKTTVAHDPRFVVGWLVCTEGNATDLGKSFRLHADENLVGRVKGYDVYITDTAVSRTKIFTVTYDVRNDRYYAVKGNGSGVYINENLLLSGAIELKKGDKLRLSDDTSLIFIPLEKEYVDWGFKK